MNDDFNMEDELANSIAQIIDEETSEAEDMYRDKLDSKANKTEPVDEDDDDYEDDDDDNNNNKRKLFIIIGAVAVSVILIVTAIVFLLKSAVNKSKNNYGYYQNLAYEAKDTDKDYDKAVEYFNKALKYKDTLLKNENVTVDGKSVKSSEILVKDMLNLRDCYDKLGKTDEEITILNEALTYDSVNTNVIYYLIQLYGDNKNYKSMSELYDTVSADENVTKDVLSLFKNYACQDPVITPAEGDYSKSQTVGFLQVNGCKIYYTMDGSDPVKNGSLYTQDITLDKEGTYEFKYYMTNEYGFKSDIFTTKYTITFKAPDGPKITPASGSYSTSSEQRIVVGNIPTGAKAYYEISHDGAVTPTTDSTEYTEPVVMPEGSFFFSVIIIDENGLSSNVVTNTYTLKKVDKFDSSAAEQLIWSTLIKNKVINDNHKTEEDGLFEMTYNSKKSINGKSIWLFSVSIDDEKQDYFYGCDSASGDIYKIAEKEGKFELSELTYKYKQ
ncbi:chitobiase/beta-hexosaminidase C-terminal domain-containing protein [Eshraghiella crossota]|uniref:chitobiase/beta-hexosaminidase C-terminal domain-containing protein n=1 Tax=Eshraghiella crossota TaxID=45851 RepID=UPI004026AFFB